MRRGAFRASARNGIPAQPFRLHLGPNIISGEPLRPLLLVKRKDTNAFGSQDWIWSALWNPRRSVQSKIRVSLLGFSHHTGPKLYLRSRGFPEIPNPQVLDICHSSQRHRYRASYGYRVAQQADASRSLSAPRVPRDQLPSLSHLTRPLTVRAVLPHTSTSCSGISSSFLTRFLTTASLTFPSCRHPLTPRSACPTCPAVILQGQTIAWVPAKGKSYQQPTARCLRVHSPCLVKGVLQMRERDMQFRTISHLHQTLLTNRLQAAGPVQTPQTKLQSWPRGRGSPNAPRRLGSIGCGE
ncbi:hypothetical protein B0H66DRAFT_594808 [Apodospora peruviana]|uniref:Uncharacterized protein n=1 Tax=Apodospora peruviana TaxID=516989 RepID=A0AAE0M0U7_9PEZI|nr:hypothetical protein B0H66DRAFT_594808 [Apodospora peruviana]